ncbi:hypothetical protein U1Q18_048754 [Sarracenia purpurea var. burkii]
MYEGTACFDPNTMQEGLSEDGNSQTLPNCTTSFSMEDLTYHQNPPLEEVGASFNGAATAANIEIEFHHHLGLDMEHYYTTTTDNTNINNTHLMQEVVHDPNQLFPYDHSNWDPNLHHGMQEMSFTHTNLEEHFHRLEIQNRHHLLNLFHLPRYSPPSLLPNSSLPGYMKPTKKCANFPPSLGFLRVDLLSSTGSASGSNGVYESHNLPPQPPFFEELFNPIGHGYNNLPGSRNGSFFGGNSGIEEREASGGLYQDGEGGRSFGNGVFEFSTKDGDINCVAKESNGGKGTIKHITTERERRENYGGKFKALKNLVPNPTKDDRASIVADAIKYINELRRKVYELKILVERKRCGRERRKRHKAEEGGATAADPRDLESWNNVKPEPDDHSYDGSSSLRSSWLQRKCKDAEVDVRIVDDEVTIKLAQRKKANCLLVVSKVLDDLQLDVQHAAGGLVGDNYSFLFNSKISEGSFVYASAIANKLIEVVNRQYAAIPPTSNH